MKSLSSLEEALSYHFQDPDLLEKALTHSSFAKEDNQRLEFLGDACLGFLIAEMVYQKYPQKKEGSLSQLRAFLIKKETLAQLAKKFSISSYLRLGPSHPQQNLSDKTLADCFEAVIAAIYLDGGQKQVQDLLYSWYSELFADVLDKGQVRKDPKTRLQEFCQSQSYALPVYTILEKDSSPVVSRFIVEVVLASLNISAQGEAATKRLAEMQAAEKLLKDLGDGHE